MRKLLVRPYLSKLRVITVLKYLLRIWRRQRFQLNGYRNINKTSIIHKSVQIIGLRQIEIGSGALISSDTWININNRNHKEIKFKLGDRAFIGRRNFFSVGNKIDVGPFVMTSVDCRFLGSSHLSNDIYHPYQYQPALDDDEIVIGANVMIGANVTVVGSVRIGHGSVIGAGSTVVSDIQPFTLAVGHPAKPVKVFCFKTMSWQPYHGNDPERPDFPTEDEYIQKLRLTVKGTDQIDPIVLGVDKGML